MLSTIARPYSTALFEQANIERQLNQWLDFLNFLAVIVADKSLQSMVRNPKYSNDELQNLMLSFLDDCSNTQKNFVRLLVANKRLGFVAEILAQYEMLKAKQDNKVRVEVISAYELSDLELATIVTMLEKKLNNKIEVNQQVNSELLGGVIIRVGDMVINASVLGSVEQFASAIV